MTYNCLKKKKEQISFNFISNKLHCKKKPFERQDLKMGKAEEEQLVVTAQKYPCLYDEVNPAFHDKNEGKGKQTNNDICRDIQIKQEKNCY